MRYRKKPVVIEAVQYKGALTDEIKALLESGNNSWFFNPTAGISIVTLEGVMLCEPFDWVIKGVAGELYPCDPDIFEKTYERVSMEPGTYETAGGDRAGFPD